MGIMTVVLALLALQGAQDSPDAIVRKALGKHAEYKEIIRATLDCSKDELVEELDGNDKVKKIIARDDDTNDRNGLRMSIAKLLKEGRFRYSLSKFEVLNNRPVIRLGFSPNSPDKQPKPEPRPGEGIRVQEIENGLNKVLNSLNGELYLDQETMGIVKVEARLPKTVFHMMGWMSRTDIEYHQSFLFGIWVPEKMVTTTRLAKIIPRPRQTKRTTITYSNYRPKAP